MDKIVLLIFSYIIDTVNFASDFDLNFQIL
jgi:hypothetical protein